MVNTILNFCVSHSVNLSDSKAQQNDKNALDAR